MNKIKKIEIKEKTKNLVVDPESYEAYLKRLSKHRNNIQQNIKREKSLPGSGNIWRRKTLPANKQLITDNDDFSKARRSLHYELHAINLTTNIN